MTDHLSDEIVKGYRAKSLPVSELLAVDDHLAECEACRRRAGADAAGSAWAQIEAQLRAGPVLDVRHLSYGQISSYVDETLPADQRAAARLHLAECDACTREVKDLQGFAQQFERAPIPIRARRSWTWGGAAAIAAAMLLAAVLWKSPAPHGPVKGTPAARLTLQDGSGSLGLDSRGRLFGSAAGADPEAVKSALESGRLALAIPPGVQTKSSVLLGPETPQATFRVLNPVAEAVTADRPRLIWEALTGATGYQVQIFDTDYQPVAGSSVIPATTWQPEKPLKRGRIYAWQVVAIRKGDRITAPRTPQPEARFQVLDEATATRIQAARSAPNPSHLALAILLAQAGARQEARQELAELARRNPNAPIVAALGKSLE